MPSIGYAGKSYPLVAQDKMTPGETDAVERATGLTLAKIRRMGETCVCEHDKVAHTHKDDAGEINADDTSCTLCTCRAHVADMPSRVMTAFAWVSVHRVDRSVKYSDFSDAPLSDWEVEDEGEEDPTEPPLAAE